MHTHYYAAGALATDNGK